MKRETSGCTRESLMDSAFGLCSRCAHQVFEAMLQEVRDYERKDRLDIQEEQDRA